MLNPPHSHGQFSSLLVLKRNRCRDEVKCATKLEAGCVDRMVSPKLIATVVRGPAEGKVVRQSLSRRPPRRRFVGAGWSVSLLQWLCWREYSNGESPDTVGR